MMDNEKKEDFSLEDDDLELVSGGKSSDAARYIENLMAEYGAATPYELKHLMGEEYDAAYRHLREILARR